MKNGVKSSTRIHEIAERQSEASVTVPGP